MSRTASHEVITDRALAAIVLTVAYLVLGGIALWICSPYHSPTGHYALDLAIWPWLTHAIFLKWLAQ